MTEQSGKRRSPARPAPRRRPPPARATADAAKGQIEEIEARLEKLEILLRTVRAEAGKSTGPARLRLEHIEKLVATRIASTRATLKTSMERMSQALADSKKNVEREVGLLTRGLKAGVRASRDAYRGKRDT